MNRSFLINVLVLIAFEISMITVAFYATRGDHHHFIAAEKKSAAQVATAGADAGQQEVVVLWSAPDAAIPAIYTVVRRDRNKADDQTIIATIDTTEMRSYAGYYRVADDRTDGGEYSYEVISVSNAGTKVVTSIALAV